MNQNPLESAQAVSAIESSPAVKFTKNDAIAVTVLGFIIGIFTPVILGNINKVLPLQGYFFIIFPILAVLSTWIVYSVAGRIPIIIQIVKFGAIGAANTVIDFGILNFLSGFFSIFSGPFLIILNIISFSAAVTNSYFWNKYWTFKAGSASLKLGETGKENSGRQFIEFIVVSVIGLGINTGIVYLVTTFASPFGGVSQAVWLNIGKLAATFISLAWNFVGYKFIVFKR